MMTLGGRHIGIGAALLLLTLPVSSQSDAKLEHDYVSCLARLGVNPGSMTQQDVEFCNVEAGVPDPGDEAREISGKAWRTCLMQQAATFDDGISPADVIAESIVLLCSSEWKAYVDSLWMTPAAKSLMRSRFRELAPDEGRMAVLTQRREKNSGAPPDFDQQ